MTAAVHEIVPTAAAVAQDEENAHHLQSPNAVNAAAPAQNQNAESAAVNETAPEHPPVPRDAEAAPALVANELAQEIVDAAPPTATTTTTLANLPAPHDDLVATEPATENEPTETPTETNPEIVTATATARADPVLALVHPSFAPPPPLAKNTKSGNWKKLGSARKKPRRTCKRKRTPKQRDCLFLDWTTRKTVSYQCYVYLREIFI